MSRSAPFLCSGLRFSQYAERSLALSYAWCARAPVSVRLRACSYNLLLRRACAPLEIQTTMILVIITVRSPRAFTSTLRCARRAPLLLHYGAFARLRRMMGCRCASSLTALSPCTPGSDPSNANLGNTPRSRLGVRHVGNAMTGSGRRWLEKAACHVMVSCTSFARPCASISGSSGLGFVIN